MAGDRSVVIFLLLLFLMMFKAADSRHTFCFDALGEGNPKCSSGDMRHNWDDLSLPSSGGNTTLQPQRELKGADLVLKQALFH